MLKLFTFIIEKSGSTDIHQIEAVDINDAISTWKNQVKGRNPKTKMEVSLDEDFPTPISGLINVWCFSFIDDEDIFILLHIVDTVLPGP
jgi:hypothetical protein